MSYNLLSGSVEFVGDALGLAEDLVNTHATQTITGAKTFTNITASNEGDSQHALVCNGDTSINGELLVEDYIKHVGDTDTFIQFLDNEVEIKAGDNLGLNITTGHVAINGDGTPRNQNLDFVVYTRDTNNGLKVDANTRSIQIGSIGNPSFNRSDVLLNITSSYHSGSLLSVGDGKNPVLAVSGSTGDVGQGPRVVITGSLLVGSPDAGSAETRFAGGNIIAAGVVTGSFGLRGELLNIHNGLEHVDSGGEKKLAVKASQGITVNGNGVSVNNHTGISVSADGVAVDVDSLSDVGSVNTSTSNQDFICVSDYSNSNATAKMGVGDLLAQTIGSVANTGTGDGQIFKTTTSREAKLKRIAAGTGITVTNGTDDVTIAAQAPPVATYNGAGAGRLIISVNTSTITGVENLKWSAADDVNCFQVTGALNVRNDITASAFTATGAGFYGNGSNLTNISAGGGNSQVQVNISGALNSSPSYTAVQSQTPHNTELYLTGALHAHHVEVAQTLVVDSQTTLYNTEATHLTASSALFTGAQRITTTLKTTNYTVADDDRVVIFNSNTNLTATLPPITANNVGRVYTVKNLNSGEVHITGSNPGVEQYIDGVQYLVLSGAMVGHGPYLTVTSYASGAGFDWAVIARDLNTL